MCTSAPKCWPRRSRPGRPEHFGRKARRTMGFGKLYLCAPCSNCGYLPKGRISDFPVGGYGVVKWGGNHIGPPDDGWVYLVEMAICNNCHELIDIDCAKPNDDFERIAHLYSLEYGREIETCRQCGSKDVQVVDLLYSIIHSDPPIRYEITCCQRCKSQNRIVLATQNSPSIADFTCFNCGNSTFETQIIAYDGFHQEYFACPKCHRGCIFILGSGNWD